MKYFVLTHMGEFHINHNEDYFVIEDAGKDRKLIAVMDGCSSGTDSHLASTLIGKVLRKLAKQEAYREYAQKNQSPLKQLLENMALSLFEELGNISRQLDLQSDELLSTLILGLVDQNENTAELMIVGDGMIHINGENIEYENDNKPDYIGYHLNMNKHLWYQTRTIRKSIQNLKDLTISTDGIHTFKNYDGKKYPVIENDQIMVEFYTNLDNLDNPNKLKKSLLKIKQIYGLMPSDDLTMIRFVCVN